MAELPACDRQARGDLLDRFGCRADVRGRFWSLQDLRDLRATVFSWSGELVADLNKWSLWASVPALWLTVYWVAYETRACNKHKRQWKVHGIEKVAPRGDHEQDRNEWQVN